ncbi:unnamed protein product [Amoebophrya sp. A25]|nr:unnamed protein product [Amoebophrya sp. A25]|eukprot:GSA25T00006712001.1
MAPSALQKRLLQGQGSKGNKKARTASIGEDLLSSSSDDAHAAGAGGSGVSGASGISILGGPKITIGPLREQFSHFRKRSEERRRKLAWGPAHPKINTCIQRTAPTPVVQQKATPSSSSVVVQQKVTSSSCSSSSTIVPAPPAPPEDKKLQCGGEGEEEGQEIFEEDRDEPSSPEVTAGLDSDHELSQAEHEADVRAFAKRNRLEDDTTSMLLRLPPEEYLDLILLKCNKKGEDAATLRKAGKLTVKENIYFTTEVVIAAEGDPEKRSGAKSSCKNEQEEIAAAAAGAPASSSSGIISTSPSAEQEPEAIIGPQLPPHIISAGRGPGFRNATDSIKAIKGKPSPLVEADGGSLHGVRFRPKPVDEETRKRLRDPTLFDPTTYFSFDGNWSGFYTRSRLRDVSDTNEVRRKPPTKEELETKKNALESFKSHKQRQTRVAKRDRVLWTAHSEQMRANRKRLGLHGKLPAIESSDDEEK